MNDKMKRYYKTKYNLEIVENDVYDWKTHMDNNTRSDLCGVRMGYQLLLEDGTSVSIQASKFHYCEPREDFDTYHKYTEFELGFPNCVIEEIMPYVEDEDNPTSTVYGYVPSEVIDAFVRRCGGVVCSVSTEG